MKWLNRILVVIVIVCLMVAAPNMGFAQPVDPGCDPLDPACPIDGGLSLLIAAGIGIGAKKAYQAKKKQEQSA